MIDEIGRLKLKTPANGSFMQRSFGERLLELRQGDITAQEVDAIVNAANSRLAGGGGVDGAIHRQGGPTIMEETRRRYPDGCPSGSAVISGAGALPVKYVLHAVGPVWQGGHAGESELLESAYRRCFELAVEHRCASIALPALSTGAYGYPMDQASRIALGAAIAALESAAGSLRLARFVLFSPGAYGAFAAALEELTAKRGTN